MRVGQTKTSHSALPLPSTSFHHHAMVYQINSEHRVCDYFAVMTALRRISSLSLTMECATSPHDKGEEPPLCAQLRVSVPSAWRRLIAPPSKLAMWRLISRPSLPHSGHDQC